MVSPSVTLAHQVSVNKKKTTEKPTKKKRTKKIEQNKEKYLG
jgi:hypothetical protein